MKTTVEVCDNEITFEMVEPGTVFSIMNTKVVFVKTEIIETTKNKTKEIFNAVCLSNGTHLFVLVDTKIKVYNKVECK